MNLKIKINYIIVLLVILLSFFIGFNSLSPSKPNYTDNTKTNVNNQMEHIKILLQNLTQFLMLRLKKKLEII